MAPSRHKVGEARPSQLLFSFGVGCVIDLPNLSTIVMGLEDWDALQAREISEDRLLAAARRELGTQVERLLSPPQALDTPGAADAFDPAARVGVPVAPFPRWMLCPSCRLLAPLHSGLFDLKADPFRPDRTRYVHINCNKRVTPPVVLPARFLVACMRGHLDDFPWVSFVHRGNEGCRARLRLREYGVSGEAADIYLECEVCQMRRSMSDAFGESGGGVLPTCHGRRPHLRDFEEDGCSEPMRAILLGASNSWFPLALSVLSVPAAHDRLAQLVADSWTVLEGAVSKQNIELLRRIGQLRAFASFTDEAIWQAVEAHRASALTSETLSGSLKTPEWLLFASPEQAPSSSDFRLRPVDCPGDHSRLLQRVVLVERLREVRTLVGFTRIESPGDFDEVTEVPEERRAPLTRRAPRWLPASEVRGEGIFVQFREEAIAAWLQTKAVRAHEALFREAHRHWRQARRLSVDDAGFPGSRYVLLHSFAHILMRQLALECGYAAASIRERIYALPPHDDDGPMAGILLYTAAADSEGTLGGLVNLGRPAMLGRLIDSALELSRLCASDPLCAEHRPDRDSSLHAAACHACLFAPETSCERGNKYLDRSVLVATVSEAEVAFFPD